MWHGFGSLSDYTKENTPFLSEFGLQALPARASLERFLPHDALWPPNPLWTTHHAELAKLDSYARSGAGSPTTLDDFISASQRAQALGVQLAVERMRRRKAAGAGGVAIWQWNEPWPAISWALVDYFGTPKLAAERLRDWYHPLLLSLEFDWDAVTEAKTTIQGDVPLWAINDLGETFQGCEARLLQRGSCVWSAPITLAPFSATPVALVAGSLLDPRTPLRVELWQAGTLLARNEYEFRLPGPRRTAPRHRLYRTLVEWLTRW